MDCIYHGCFRKAEDGTNWIIGPGEKCLVPVSKPFWKYIEDIPSSIKLVVSIICNLLLILEEMILIFKIKTKRILDDSRHHPIRRFVS